MTENKDQGGLVPRRDQSMDKSEDESVEQSRVPDHLIESLSPDQLKFARMFVTTSMSAQDVGAHLGVSKRKVGRWKNDDNVKLYMDHLKKRLHQDDLENAKAQNRFLREQMWKELSTRFEKFDEDKLPDDISVTEKTMRMKRHAEFAEFKDLMKLFKDVDDRTQRDSENSQESIERDEFVRNVRRRFHKRTLRRKRKDEVLKENGINPDKMFDTIAINSDGTVNMEETKEAYENTEPDGDYEEIHEEIIVEEIDLD